MVDARDAWATKSYVARLGEAGDRYRVNAQIDRGQVLRYTVQFEAFIDGRFYAVMRYDTAHGAPHRDTIDWSGHVIDKEWLPYGSLNRAMTKSIEDVRANWEILREEFMRRKP